MQGCACLRAAAARAGRWAVHPSEHRALQHSSAASPSMYGCVQQQQHLHGWKARQCHKGERDRRQQAGLRWAGAPLALRCSGRLKVACGQRPLRHRVHVPGSCCADALHCGLLTRQRACPGIVCGSAVRQPHQLCACTEAPGTRRPVQSLPSPRLTAARTWWHRAAAAAAAAAGGAPGLTWALEDSAGRCQGRLSRPGSSSCARDWQTDAPLAPRSSMCSPQSRKPSAELLSPAQAPRLKGPSGAHGQHARNTPRHTPRLQHHGAACLTGPRGAGSCSAGSRSAVLHRALQAAHLHRP